MQIYYLAPTLLTPELKFLDLLKGPELSLKVKEELSNGPFILHR
jgi:hypothetical protein